MVARVTCLGTGHGVLARAITRVVTRFLARAMVRVVTCITCLGKVMTCFLARAMARALTHITSIGKVVAPWHEWARVTQPCFKRAMACVVAWAV